MPSHRAPHPLISGHFQEVGSVQNKSNRKYYECKYCDNPKKIENRDNKCLIHLSDAGKCPNTPEDVRKAALQAIKGKRQSIEGKIIESVFQDDPHGDNDIGMDSDVAYGSSSSSRKRKAPSGVQSWVDNALTPAQQEKANIKLFWSVEIKSYHCLISTYFQALWLHCPQQQPILSQSELLIL